MKITLYSNLFKIEDYIVIIEIYKEKNEEKYLYVNVLDEKNEHSLEVKEKKFSYLKQAPIKLIFCGEKQEKYSFNVKNGLTYSLEKINKDNYIVYLQVNQSKKQILKLELI
jgi:hypothetical protein